jgi:hypothetical protein
MDFSNHREGGMVFYIRFSSFLLYSAQSLNRKNISKRLREFKEIEISRQTGTVEVTVNSNEENA